MTAQNTYPRVESFETLAIADRRRQYGDRASETFSHLVATNIGVVRTSPRRSHEQGLCLR